MEILFPALLVSFRAGSGHVTQCWPVRPKGKTGGEIGCGEFFALLIKKGRQSSFRLWMRSLEFSRSRDLEAKRMKANVLRISEQKERAWVPDAITEQGNLLL